MLKQILAVMLMLASVHYEVLAHDVKAAVAHQAGIAIATGWCTAVMQKSPVIGADLRRTTETFLAPNDKLHFCQYVREQIGHKCFETKTCVSYNDWTKANPNFTPQMPRQQFIDILELRLAKLSLLAKLSP